MKTAPYISSLQVIVGLGKTGLSCVRYLTEQGFNVAVTDSREQPPGLDELQHSFPQTLLSLGKFDEDLCLKAERIILSPGVPLYEPTIAQAVKAGIPVIGDIELFALAAKAPVVGITGSNGKSTVTTLVGEMGKTGGIDLRVGGNLGEPALNLLQPPTPHAYVLELSSFQLETTFSLHTQGAVILNLSEDHMDRYQNLSEYLKAKQRIYMHCQQPIINRDDPFTWKELSLKNPFSFGFDTPTTSNEFGLIIQEGVTYFARGTTCLMPIHEMKMKGKHQVANALAALALGTTIQLPLEAMLQTLRVFPGLRHRCQWIATIDGVNYYNDSKATNVGSAQVVIEGLGHDVAGKLVVIAGGQGKGADFTVLSESMHKYVKLLILMGQDAPLMEKALAGHVPIQHVSDLNQAVIIAHQTAVSGDAVVLAPACASLDMFKNFEERGEIYMQQVSALT